MRPYYDDGQVTIHCGDCRDILPGICPASVALVLTDPPYGIGFDTDFGRFGHASNRTWAPVRNDDRPFEPALLEGFRRRVLWGGNYYADRLGGGKWLVWNKRDLLQTPNVLSDGELAWHNCEGPVVRVFNWFWNGRYRKGETGTAYHPCQKPVALMRWVLQEYTRPGDLVLDPFAGSGTVARACLDLGRRCVAVEIEESYCDVIVRRLAQQVLPLEGAA